MYILFHCWLLVECGQAGDVVFAVDASGSIEQVNFNKMIKFLASLITDLDVDHSRQNNQGTRCVNYLHIKDISVFLLSQCAIQNIIKNTIQNTMQCKI